ncbi:MAG: phosphatidylserine/phosphatidylglycerophosphate/cardiolipin synthase family protein [Thaumarchaeota archaeon]|nr:phosphatidylserine/phosphatidylglycerophosphate/cardiolipin synthase family protein [Nitrososphaerota archaeon]
MKTTTVKNNINPINMEVNNNNLALRDNSKLLAHLTDVFSVLSKNDALTIFLISEEGIRSELDTPAKIGLTKKQYYTRLKQLVDLGLVVKNNESYIQTAFGKVVYQKHILGLSNNIKNSKYLQMVDVLRANPKFDDKDIMEFISKVEPQINSDLQESSRKNSTVAASYEDMIRKILEMIEFAQSEILLVTRFQNELIINSILKKASSGINVKILADNGMVKEYFEKESQIKSDKNQTEREKVVSNPFYPSKADRRYVQVPFCFIIVDNKFVGLEIIDIVEPRKFKMAIFAEDPILSSSMITSFNNLWQKSDANPPKIVTKTH